MPIAVFRLRPVFLTMGVGRVLAAETSTLLAAMTVQPDQTRRYLIDDLIGSLKTAGVWTKLDFLHVMAAHDAQAARINWITPAQVGTVSGTVTFTADRGYAGDGVSGYIDTGLNYSTLPTYRQDNAHIGVWCVTEAQSTNFCIGSITTNLGVINPRSTTNQQVSRVNASSGASIANSVAKGHSVATRGNATNQSGYKNGALLGSPALASVAITTNVITYFRAVSGYDSRQVAAGHGGINLTATEITDLYGALNTYMTAVGVAP